MFFFTIFGIVGGHVFAGDRAWLVVATMMNRCVWTVAVVALLSVLDGVLWSC